MFKMEILREVLSDSERGLIFTGKWKEKKFTACVSLKSFFFFLREENQLEHCKKRQFNCSQYNQKID